MFVAELWKIFKSHVNRVYREGVLSKARVSDSFRKSKIYRKWSWGENHLGYSDILQAKHYNGYIKFK